MKVNYFDNQGKLQTGKKELDDSVFAVHINKKLLNQYLYVYLSNQRESNAHTKDRGVVRGGGKKPWRQKGTGRARHGSIRSPIWKGGGVTFGPTNLRNYKKKFNKKMIKGAFRAAFSILAVGKQLSVIRDISADQSIKTKDLLELLTRAKLVTYKTLLVTAKKNENLLKAARNLPVLQVTLVNELNPFILLKAKQILFSEETLPVISQFWGETVKSVKQVKSKAEPKQAKAQTVKKEVKLKQVIKKKIIKKSAVSKAIKKKK